jgi:hypothetical protein
VAEADGERVAQHKRDRTPRRDQDLGVRQRQAAVGTGSRGSLQRQASRRALLGLRHDHRDDPSAAARLDWSELRRRDIRSYEVTIRSTFDRLEKVEDPWTDFWRRGVSLSKARQKLEKLDAART